MARILSSRIRMFSSGRVVTTRRSLRLKSLHGFSTGRNIATTAGWLTGPEHRQNDVAFVQFASPFTGITPFKYAATPANGDEIIGVVGYPGDMKYKSEGGAQMYEVSIETHESPFTLQGTWLSIPCTVVKKPFRQFRDPHPHAEMPTRLFKPWMPARGTAYSSVVTMLTRPVGICSCQVRHW